MGNVPVVTARTLIAVLKKKEFRFIRSVGSHHIFVRDADQVSVSVPVHPGHDLGRGITRQILRDAAISIEEFLRLR